jgi:hypothetical protein
MEVTGEDTIGNLPIHWDHEEVTEKYLQRGMQLSSSSNIPTTRHDLPVSNKRRLKLQMLGQRSLLLLQPAGQFHWLLQAMRDWERRL